jgi:hypothetical protein
MDRHLAFLPIGTYDTSLESDTLVSIADAHLSEALSMKSYPLDPSHASFLETSTGIFTLVVLRTLENSRAHKTNPFANVWQQCAKALLKAIQSVSKEDGDRSAGTMSDDGSEVLYGRAGLLYAVLLLRSAINRPSLPGHLDPVILARISPIASDDNVRALVDSLIVRGKAGSAQYAKETREDSVPSLMWSWHGKRYLGAAHGVG